MATNASKRKQDEKHLKLLREMVALSHNKTCFDCHQRGPTYVNMTIGSFICTSCSGILRGINPPHRVKSISMTSFTPEEMDLLRSRGNEFCKKVWLAKFNPSIHREPDSKDEHKVREYMAEKYEKKRYYTEATEALHEEARTMNTPVAKPDTKSIRSLTGNTLPSLRVQSDPTHTSIPKPAAQPGPIQIPGQVAVSQAASTTGPAPIASTQPAPSKPGGFDLLSDLGGDPFGGPARPAPQNNDGGGFADFSNFNSAPQAATVPTFPQAPQATPAFSTGAGLLQPLGSQSAAASTPSATAAAVPSSSGTQLTGNDRYAALASLDNVFGGGGTNATVNWDGSMMVGGGGPNVPWGNGSAVPTSSYTFGASAGTNSTVAFGGKPNSSASNPFGTSPVSYGGPTVTTTTTASSNPFLGGGYPQQHPPSYTQVYGHAAQAGINMGGFGQYNSASASSGPANSVAGSQQHQAFGMQNGGFGQSPTTSQQGFQGQQQPSQPGYNVGPGAQSAQGFGSMPGAQPGQGFGGGPGVQPGQFGANQMMPQGGQFGQKPGQAVNSQQQQFAAWGGGGSQQAGNPFMAPSAPQAIPPRATSTNPFL